ncbi:hypothetical protein C2E23DRAFT_841314 [Lenzites betulinus]|nr:hypothetical protein C2E23DRAFT_841314 [Lenzites betulinus]
MNTEQEVQAAHQKVPIEIWLEILALVPVTADLHALSLTSRRFYDLTVRALHRDLVWAKAEHVARSLPMWEANQGMDTAVRSLDLGVCTVLPGMPVPMIGLDGRREQHAQRTQLLQDGAMLQETLFFYRLSLESKGNLATEPLHDAMLARIQTFTNISTLAFTSMILSNTHLSLIHSLPQLRNLRLELCLFHEGRGGPPPPTNHVDLPITELTILNHRRCITNILFSHVSFDGNIMPILTLCTARSLRTLTVDSSADVFRHVYRVFEAPAQGWPIPPNLEHVFVLRRRIFQNEVQPMYPGENNFPERHLYHFAVQARALRTLSTPTFAPQNVTIAAEVLPRTLERFAAPVETAAYVAAVRNVEALGVLQCALGSREAINALESIATSRPQLKMLMLELRGWDEEVISAVVNLFKSLRRLKIVYEGEARPSEDFLVALGPEFLPHMPYLHTLELYAQPTSFSRKAEHPSALYDSSFGSIEEELLNMVIPYNRYSKTLRKVQFSTGYVVQRAFEGARWSVERLRRVEEKDDLSY